jgi:glycosyltransferase involved in cell wall biosynthesis
VIDRRCRSIGGSRVLYLLTHEVSSGLVRGQLDYLSAQGFDVHAASGCDRNTQPKGFDASASVFRLPLVREPSPVRDFVALVATIRLIRRLRPSVVNASTPKASVVGLLAARLCGVPVRVFVIRGLRYQTMKGWRRHLLQSLDRIAGQCATHVLANSQSLLEVAVRDGIVREGTAEVIRFGSGNGLNLARFNLVQDRSLARRQFGLARHAPVIGFVGRLTRDKGVEDLLAVFDVLSASIADCQLLIVGPFDEGDAAPSAVRTRIRKTERITHVSWLTDPSLAYAAMDLLVFPSYREGLPNVPIEAQACGLPVIAYASTGTTDAVEDGIGGHLVTTGDRVGLAQLAINLLTEENRLHILSAGGRGWVVERFDQTLIWAAIADRYRQWTGRVLAELGSTA